MHELVNKYVDIFTKQSKPVAQNIKRKIELIDPEKPLPHYRLPRMHVKKLQEVQNPLQEYLKDWI